MLSRALVSHFLVNNLFIECESMRPIYSICITNSNTVESVKQSLESILAQVDDRFEIIVVDNCSDDGSLEILREYQDKRLKLIVEKCSRGLGRQTAIRNSRGKYIISHMDMDDVFKRNLARLLQIYHTHLEGYMLVAQRDARAYAQAGIMIAPRELIDRIGGYRDLNYLEDRELFSRAAQLGYFRFLKYFPMVGQRIKKRKFYLRVISLLRKEYLMFRESFRIGRGSYYCYRIFVRKPFFFVFRFPIAFWAFITHLFYPKFHNEFFRVFNMYDYEIRIDEPLEKLM
jgi:glycosyltransferase involved in cell wall biosynthesis